jgi:hypothetical protein
MAVNRRELLRLTGVASAALLVGCDRSAPVVASCAARPRRPSRRIVRPEQTEGPYFVDERLNRSTSIEPRTAR